MKATVQILICIFLVSCEIKSDRITSTTDLKLLVSDFNVELQQAKLETVCNKSGLQRVEEFLESKSEAEQQQYVLKVGAYLGNCIIESYGGEWIEYEPGIWGIKLSEKNFVFPIGKVQKFVDDPTGDSFSSFYAMIPIVFKLDIKKP